MTYNSNLKWLGLEQREENCMSSTVKTKLENKIFFKCHWNLNLSLKKIWAIP